MSDLGAVAYLFFVSDMLILFIITDIYRLLKIYYTPYFSDAVKVTSYCLEDWLYVDYFSFLLAWRVLHPSLQTYLPEP